MKYFLSLFVCIILSILSFEASGQINITYPSSRAIFQRDKNNSARIYVAGSYSKPADRIEAKLIAINGGADTDWVPIQSNPQGGFYSGSVVSSGGWYELRVRGMRGDQETESRTMSPVGIGEVFLIAGQSNAQGFQDYPNFSYGAQRANDDRVNCIAYSNNQRSDVSLPYPSFAHLESNSQISPRGQSAWSWGKLGDILAERLRVPILFYNVAWEGTLVRTWRESITGTAYSPYIPASYDPSGMPYSNLRSVMQNYVPITGIRGVLWQQGEADNQFDTRTEDYVKDLRAVIDASRNESGKGSLAWVISITSYTNRYGTDNNVIQGQKNIISTANKIFQGPNTDQIQIPRTDFEGVHLHNEGLTSLGEAWSNALNNDFFSNSDPYQAVSPLEITANCAGNNSISLSVKSDGYSSINWNTGQNTPNIQVGNGTFRVTARDSRGNMIYSPEISVSQSIYPAQPTISLQGSNPVCLGNTAVLISNTAENVRWNTGSTSDRLPVTTGGEYFVTARNVYGCETSSSRISVAVLNSPLPEKPAITALGALTFCEGGEVSLQSNSRVNNRWSNGANTGSISVKSSGEYRVQALDNLGCFSPESDPVTVKVNPLPAKPSIALSGSSTFCAGGNVTLTSSYESGNTWSNAAVSKTISVNESGSFSLKQRDSNGCESTSDAVNIKVNPLPPTPTITALRPTTFCTRDFTTLRSSDAATYLWSNGANNKEINIYESGSYTISQIDGNRCVSPPSAAVLVVANPLPPTPVITADGPTVFCADLSVNLTSTTAAGFLWSNGSSSQSIKVNIGATFTVQTINEFKCYSDKSNQISTRTLALPPAPSVAALGETIFCDGNFVALKASNGNSFVWNTGTEKDSIHATQSGAYSARVKDTQGCLSPNSREILVDVKPTPTAPIIKQIGVFTLKSENNINDGDHVWKLNATILPEKSTILKAIQSGSYVVNNTVVYSPTLSCFSDFSAPFNFVADTQNNGLVAYPSPATDGRLNIETVQNINNATVQIIDTRGVIHKVYKVAKFDSIQFFNISDLSSGSYIIRIISGSLNASQKIIIVK
ncbi:T9SS type A sorting domain-containing protein [Dyadobacter psychrotolerans]|uniref:T9SS type A sorting domain-containing protein n=1 Tax=Dyadobacter psychrotolerans TaxID=2541721 RepID=A0A4V2Z3R8_9BACT|nr:T9SS type A sorting domain-containing protein [Dyadobacter psychrotolerans]TDE13718.1 T9SS type A sorting domain-containing protein [Dyadobacter psychrotolerans]